MLENLRRHAGTLNQRSADCCGFAITEHQDVVYVNDVSRLTLKLFDDDDIVPGDLVLLAAGLEHCVHLIL